MLLLAGHTSNPNGKNSIACTDTGIGLAGLSLHGSFHALASLNFPNLVVFLSVYIQLLAMHLMIPVGKCKYFVCLCLNTYALHGQNEQR